MKGRIGKKFLFLLVSTWVLGSAIAAPASAATEFRDIKGHWATQTVNHLVGEGILDGFQDGTFRPDEPVTADQFVKMLILSYSDQYPNGDRSWKQPFVQSLSKLNQSILQRDYSDFTFTPSSSGYWAKPFIDVASDLNFVSKSSFPDFKVNLKREQAAEIAYYTIKATEFLEDESFSMQAAAGMGDFASAKPREQKFMAEVLTKGIMDGYPNGYFGIGQYVTRAESLTILERLTDRSKRVHTKEAAAESNTLIVPTKDGKYKKIVFPSDKMKKAYSVIEQAGYTRGTNYDLTETTLQLFKDADAKAKALNGRISDANTHYDEVSLWLEPVYNTSGITIRKQEGVLARNQEAIDAFVRYFFNYDAATFKQLFGQAMDHFQTGQLMDNSITTIGGYNVDIRTADNGDSIVFSITENN
ncbi:S-layer homology domain-containing protein [Paenibacillus thalictri]|uniref:S-layer homology domain-containing protein n=1 Tax=Paenibacillus thalictri TaxID=2527873 RepID=A0A4Q9DUM7_9BACL|nr:S-layer homology domain-containing protein [Paenibacillus thalictri]TBL78480.1 S-layer homology domain-containing protein [Paenibacillus thalictri]